MGGRGSRSAAGGGGINLRGGGGGNPLNAMGAGGPIPPVQPGQPVPAVTRQQLQAMSDTEFANYLAGLKSTPIDKNTYYNADWDTQRFVANVPELNKAPTVVDAQTFANMPGEAMYRTVNQAGAQTAVDICGRTMSSDVTTIGSGRMGDGFYFATNLSTSQNGYGNTRNNITATATMSAKLDPSAKIVDERRIVNMLASEKPAVRNAVLGMKSDGQWMHSGITAYAVRKGYDGVRNGSVVNLIDRTKAVWSGEIIPKR